MKVWKFVFLVMVLIGLVLGVNTAVISLESITVIGAPTLTISTTTAGQEPDSMTDSSSNLSWIQDGCTEITVETNLASPKFTLKVEAINFTAGGSSAGEKIISTTAQKLINVAGDGSCILKYTGSATVSDGMGTDSHTITFTIQ